MKKILALFLSVLLTFCIGVPALAAEGGETQELQFREDGSFRILHYCDLHSSYPLTEASTVFMQETIAALKPDLIVLGGDNCLADKDDMEKNIEEVCAIFVESGTYFTLVFGNHDEEHQVSKETLLGYYQKYGGKYCLAYDADPSLTGVGTHNLPILSADGSRVSYNIYLFDSNAYAFDEDGNRLGYDAVHPDEIEWYRNTSAALAQQNGGKVVPSLAFQHIVVQEAYYAFYHELPFDPDKLSDTLRDKTLNHFDGVWFTYLPKYSALRDGLLLEKPCPGYYNYGQLDAMSEVGDVQAVFSGHDHSNDFTIRLKDVDVVNTPTCSFRTAKANINRGVRVVDLTDGESGYKTFVYFAAEHILKTDSRIPKLDSGISSFRAFCDVVANKTLHGLVKLMNVLQFRF